MSVDYYKPRPPIGEIEIVKDPDGDQTTVHVWAEHRGRKIATVVVNEKAALIPFVEALLDMDRPAARAFYGGSDVGMVVQVLRPDVSGDDKLFSIDGEVETLRLSDLIKMAGRVEEFVEAELHSREKRQ